MQHKIVAELISGKPNWNAILGLPATDFTIDEERFLDGPVDDVCAIPGQSLDALGLDSIRAVVYSDAVVKLVSRSVDLIPNHRHPLAHYTGMAKTILRTTSALGALHPHNTMPLRLGRIAGRAWILDHLRRYTSAWQIPSQIEQVGHVLMMEILDEAAPIMAMDPDLQRLEATWIRRTSELDRTEFDLIWPGTTAFTQSSHAIRFFLLRSTNGLLAPVPIGGPSRPYLQVLSRAAAYMAWKQREQDLGWLAAAAGIIHAFEQDRRPKPTRILFHWAMHHLLGRTNSLPGGANLASTRRIGVRVMQPDTFRDPITRGMYIPPDANDVVGRLEQAFTEHHRSKRNLS